MAGTVEAPLPFEDRDAGLYVHARSRKNRTGVRLLTTDTGTGASYWVDVTDFMRIQRERDEARKTLGLINAIGRKDPQVRKLLNDHGLTEGDASAMRSLIRWGQEQAA